MICLKPFRFGPLVYPTINKGCVRPHSYFFIPAFACGERRRRVWLLALEGERMVHAGGFPNNPILSGSTLNTPVGSSFSYLLFC